MNAKVLAHTIQAGLREASQLDIQRSHAHEFIAAAFSCGSQAAMLARGVLCRTPDALAKRQIMDVPAVSRRAIGLGYTAADGDDIQRIVVSAIQRERIRLLPLDLVLELLLEGRTELYDDDLKRHADENDNGSISAGDEDAFDEEAWYAREREDSAAVIELAGEEVVSALRSAIEHGDGRAHLSMALLLIGDAEDFDGSDSRDGQYWYDREQKGQILAGVEKEWADGYRDRVQAVKLADKHLAAAADLGQADAQLIMAERFHDPRFFELVKPRVHAEPFRVAQIADSMGRAEAMLAWLEQAAEEGDMTAMRLLIRDLQRKDPLKCWTWFHLAKLHGKDLTRDDYHAIHEDGSAYDDDVGGPMFADGEDGVELPAADEATQLQAQAQAAEIFSR